MIGQEDAPLVAVTHDQAATLKLVERKSDGLSGQPVSADENHNTPGALNSALNETPKEGEGFDPNHRYAAHVKIVDADLGIVEGTRKKYAICGFASSSRAAIPVESDEWEILTLNQLYRHCKRADRHFDIHHNWNSENVPGTDHRGWIRDCGIPVYMIDRHDDLPTSVRFPIERMIEKFGDYYTSTVAHMTAYVIDEIDHRVETALLSMGEMSAAEGAKVSRAFYEQYTIGIFGIDLVVGDEYFWQKACAEYFIGIAMGRGINVMIPPQSALLTQQFRYGWHTEPNVILKPREVAEHRARLMEQHAEGLKRLNMMEGALQVLRDPPTDPTASIASVGKDRDDMIKKMLMLDGLIEADNYYHELLDLRLRGATVG